MYKYRLFILISILSIFLLSGCGQEPPPDIEPVKHEEAGQANPEDETVPESTAPLNKEKETDHSNPITENQPKETDNPLSELKVHYINVGQADSTLLQYTDNGESIAILLDAGNWNQNDVVNYLKSQNIEDIDIAIGTHPDADHIGQLDKVIHTLNVGEIWLSGNTSHSQTFERLLTAIDSKEIDYYEPRMGDEFEIGALEIDVLYPRTVSENDNDESISLKITYGDVRFIFTGDASTDDELNMLQSGFDLQADILHLGHHGSSTSTHPTFLKKVNPAVAIYSAGVDNSYGHPHEEVVNLIRNSGIQLYGTDVHGTVVVETDGKDYQIVTRKDGTLSPSSNNNNPPPSGPSNKNVPQNEAAPTNTGCIDVNSAAFKQLQEITHIGPARAEELISLRPFDSIDNLSRINGIGPARIKEIKAQGLACIGG